MSIVCCQVSAEYIEIASDSIMVRGWTQSKSNNDYTKLCEVNGMVIGSVGKCKESSLFQVYCTTRQPSAPTIQAILDFISEFAEWKNKKTGEYSIDNSYILTYKGRAFCVEGFFIQEITSNIAIGAGMDFASASLYFGNDVKKSVEVACELSAMCELPLVYFKVKRS